MNYFSQLLNVQWAHGIRQNEIHTAEPLVPEPSVAQVDIAITKLIRYNALGSDHIPPELIQARGNTAF
jgi:hypothetical protein